MLNADSTQTLDQLIDVTIANQQPVMIHGKSANAVLLSEHDWNAINETLYLLSIPGMRESLRDGMATHIDDCSAELEW
ncbi:type II toxin-antitoxin system Phd/YefM family antitoxin [Thiospirillum jenense]|uniref:Antitoxin n=1 Tax=Thiospirillum jenense TaxID=1653858 RepID=A0A839HP64_9GAMM|nr:type II toxin-antitoxin system Phd/YefM family antitoxin [Thiospirillum jenense]MBB1127052.1 type II toxin-antitoxin system Phd/YefM family antitoxin [Thiospirillum jenense]